MRIAVFAPDPTAKDGIGHHTHNLVSEWERAGHEVMWIYPERGTHVATLQTAPDADRPRSIGSRPARAVKKFRPDLVIVQFAVPAVRMSLVSLVLTTRALKRAGIPVLICCHEASRELELLGPVGRLIYRLLRWCGTGFVAFSKIEAELIAEAGLAPSVTEVPHGIEKLTRREAELERVRRSYDLRSPSVLLLGWITRSKGTDLVLRAAPEVAAAVKGVTFVLAGEPRPRTGIFRIFGWADKRYAAELSRDAALVGDGRQVRMVGYIPPQDLVPLMQAVTALVLPYRSVTQSGIAALAIAAGTPIVASDLPGMQAQLGDTARYFRTGDDHALAVALTDVLNDVATRDTMSARARRRAHNESYSRVASDLLAAGLKSSVALGPGR